MNLLKQTIEVLEKVGFQEAIDIRRELQILELQSLNKQELQKIKLQVMKSAHKNVAEAVKALEHLDMADEGLELMGLLNQGLAEIRDTLNDGE
jgi:hypothetical protein